MVSKCVLVVGAGFAGAVVARELADAGYRVDVIDQRDHIGGNAFDFINEQGIRIHRYGPHLFHTSNQRVVKWLSQFTDWLPYEHRVSARLADGHFVPLPINRQTLETVFNKDLPDEASAHALLSELALPIANPLNAEEWLYSKIGKVLTELFFSPYTTKMWGLKLADMDASVVKRIPLRLGDENRYFPDDTFQAMPKQGYTATFERIFDHPNIRVTTSTTFEKRMSGHYDALFLSMPIDAFFDFEFGRLPYRSIRFHHDTIMREDVSSQTATVNFTDLEPFTRETYWHMLPGHATSDATLITRTKEEPCADHDNDDERYYPVKAADGRFQKIYEQYRQRALEFPDITFIGRCGTYQYLDMHQVINQSLNLSYNWLNGWRPGMREFANG